MRHRRAGRDRSQIWSRRRFLAAAASAAVVAVLDPGRSSRAPGGIGGGRSGADPPVPPAAARPAALDLPIHGSPYLLATEIPFDSQAVPAAIVADPLIHFHTPGSLRDRLVLGLP